jgi:hypothetical protein
VSSAVRAIQPSLFHIDRRTYHAEGEEEEVREGYAPDKASAYEPHATEQLHNLDQPIHESETTGSESQLRKNMWKSKQYSSDDDEAGNASPKYGSFREERDVWGTADSSQK